MTLILSADNLTITINGTTVVAGVSFALSAGEILGITGESGSGKSMTAFGLMGLLPDDAQLSGAITLNGNIITPSDDDAMTPFRGACLGMVFQEPMTALNPMMRAVDQVAEVFKKHKTVKRYRNISVNKALLAIQILQRVGLNEQTARRYPHELSGGERQRVAIAIAIALKPSVIIADEPTTALDATTQKSILTLLKRLVQEDNIAMILITHDLAVMAEMADDIMVMENGRTTSQGGVSMMLAPKDPVLARLITASRLPPPPSTESTKPHQTPLLQLEGVSKSHHRRKLFSSKPLPQAVQHITTTINRGETVGLVGRSGCGKSTLVRIALALNNADAGTVTFAGVLITPEQMLPSLRPRLSAVFQDPYGSFNPRMCIADLVAEPLALSSPNLSTSDREDRIADCLAAAQVNPDYAGRRISQCSGGERQRIAFARAIITRPDLIILDEPVSALDAPHRGQLLKEMTRLSQDQGIATLFISHDLSVVRSFCPRIMVMSAGRIVEDGTAAEIFMSPSHSETKQLIAAMPDLDRALKNLGIAESER